MKFKSFLRTATFALLGGALLAVTSCSKEEEMVENTKQNITLNEFQGILDANADKSVTVQEGYTEPETGITGTLYDVSYADDNLLIADEVPQFMEKTGESIIKSMSVWTEKNEDGTIVGYWSCGAGTKNNCIRVLGFTIAW